MRAFSRKAARETPRRRHEDNEVQVEDDVKVPEWLADEAVVAWARVPVTDAVVPDAEFEKVNVADPEPPATSLSSASLSSIKISILSSPLMRNRGM
jgi:hypothetical protein